MSHDQDVVDNSQVKFDIKKWMLSFVIENPIKSFSVIATFLGFMFLLVFFVRIRHMPDMVLVDSGSVLYAVASLGVFVSVYVMFSMILPGIALSLIIRSFSGVNKFHLFCLSFAAALVWSLLLLYFFDLWPFQGYWSLGACFLAIAGVFSTLGTWCSYKWPKFETASEARGKRKVRYHFVSCCFWSFMEVAACFIVLTVPLLFVIFIGSGGDIGTATDFYAVFILSVVILAISVSAVLIASIKKDGMAMTKFVVALGLFFYALGATGSFSSIPMMSIRILGLGEINAARIVVDERTCREINGGVGQQVCRSVQDVAVVCPVIIKSRIGSDAVLDFAEMGVEAVSSSKFENTSSGAGTSEESGVRQGQASLVWLTTDGAIDRRQGKSIVRRVILDKKKIRAWQSLPGISERDKQSKMVRRSSPYVGAALATAWANGTMQIANEQMIMGEYFSDHCGWELGAEH